MCQLTLAFRGLILARPINSSILRVGLYDICKAKPCQGSYVLLNGPFYLFLLPFPTSLLAVLHSKSSLFTQKIGIQTTMGSTPRRTLHFNTKALRGQEVSGPLALANIASYLLDAMGCIKNIPKFAMLLTPHSLPNCSATSIRRENPIISFGNFKVLT